MLSRSLQKSDLEQFAPVAHDKRAMGKKSEFPTLGTVHQIAFPPPTPTKYIYG